MKRCRPQEVAATVTRDTQGKNALVSNTSTFIRRVIIILLMFRLEQKKNPHLAALNLLPSYLSSLPKSEKVSVRDYAALSEVVRL